MLYFEDSNHAASGPVEMFSTARTSEIYDSTALGGGSLMRCVDWLKSGKWLNSATSLAGGVSVISIYFTFFICSKSSARKTSVFLNCSEVELFVLKYTIFFFVTVLS